MVTYDHEMPQDPCLHYWLSVWRNFRPVNTLRPEQNGQHFADNIFKCVFLKWNNCILIRISLKFVPEGPIDQSHNAPVPYPTIQHIRTEMWIFLFQNGVLWDMGEVHCWICEISLLTKGQYWFWYWLGAKTGNKPLPESMLTATMWCPRPQWVKTMIFSLC